MINMNVGTIYHHMRHYDKAVEHLQKTIEIDPSFGQAHYSLAKVYMVMGKYEESISAALTAKKHGILWAGATLDFAYAKTGQKDKARTLLKELIVLSKTRYVPSINFAFIYAGLDENDKAFEWLDRGYEERESGNPFSKVMPEFDCFRTDPRFEKLLKKLNLFNRNEFFS